MSALKDLEKRQEKELAVTRGAARIVDAVNKVVGELGDAGQEALNIAAIELGIQRRRRKRGEDGADPGE